MGRRGFTLVEIMIVIIIIGLLAGLAIPEMIRARDTTRANICINNMVEIRDSIDMWVLETGAEPDAAVNMSDLVPTYIKSEPRCPIGNAPYVLTTVGADPVVTCPNLAPGHVLPGF